MKKRYAYSILLCSIIALTLTSVSASGAEDKGNLPELQGWNDPVAYVIGGFPIWALQDSTAPTCENCGIRIYLVTEYDEVPVWIIYKDNDWRIDTVARRGTPLEIFISDSLLRKFNSLKADDRSDTARVLIDAALTLYTYPRASCYVIVEYPHASEGYSVNDNSTAGKEYILSSYASASANSLPTKKSLVSYTSIVGIYDWTRVKFKYGGNENGYVITQTGKILTTGMIDSVMINHGDIWLIPSLGENSDITGSYVSADKPFQCFTGSSYATIPHGDGVGGFIIEQESPCYLWTNKYYIGPIKGASVNSILRLFAAYNSTTIIYRDGMIDQVAVLSDKGGIEGEGWAEIRAAEGAPRAVTLFSDKRFKVVQYNANDGTANFPPFQLNINPFNENGGTVAVKSPRMSGDSQKHYLNIIYRATSSGTFRKDFKVGEYMDKGEIVWNHISEKFGTDMGLEFTDPTIKDSSRKMYCKLIELPNNHTFLFQSYDRFMVYSYGSSLETAYGYSVSEVGSDLYLPDTISPYVHYSIDDEGYVPALATASTDPAYVKDMPDDEESRSNLGFLYFVEDESYNYNFQFDAFEYGEDRYTKWSLTPINPARRAKAVIIFSDRNWNDTTIVIDHPGPLLSVTPSVQFFGEVISENPKTLAFTLTNNSNDGSVLKPGNVRLQKGDQGFHLNYSFDPEIPLNPGESLNFSVTFEGRLDDHEYTDLIGVGDGDNFSYIAKVIALGAKPEIYVESIDLFDVQINTTKFRKGVTIRNHGSAPLVITGYSGPTLEEFKVSLSNWGITPEKPLIIQPGEREGFDVYFTPREAREYLDSIVFETEFTERSDNICYLRGTGVDSIISIAERYPQNNSNAFNAAVLPNPVDSRGGQLEFENPSDGTVEIVLFNSQNQQVAILQSGWMKAGKHTITVPVETLPSGAYTLRLISGKSIGVQNLLIAK